MTLVSPPISQRALAILGRFPRHLDAARPDKLFAQVVHALAVDLELQTSQLGRIRRAHRLGMADEVRDLHLLGGLHLLRPADFDALQRRFTAARTLATALAVAAAPDLAGARAALAALVGAGQATFVAWPGEADDRDAIARLVAAVRAATSYAAETDRLRRRIAVTAAIHRAGNGTIGALLRGAANALDLDVVSVRHSKDGFWHLADCRDRVVLTRPEPPGAVLDTVVLADGKGVVRGKTSAIVRVDGEIDAFTLTPSIGAARTFQRGADGQPPATPPGAPPLEDFAQLIRGAVVVPPPIDLVALEENPFAPRKVDPFPVHHAHRFTITRAGFDPVPVSIHVTGVQDHTAWPMVVNRDAGQGVAFHGAVPDGVELIFNRDHTATLGGTDVVGQTWAFQGAVFAEAGENHPLDFLFTDGSGAIGTATGQPAVFATAIPYGAAFDPTATWPHAAGIRPVPELAVGATRWAYFVREATFGTTDSTGAVDVPSVAYFAAGVWDESVFAGTPLPDAGKIGFDWTEREPFAVRILIPERFAALDDPATPPATPPITEVVRGAIERYRAAGVRLTVAYTDELWTLGDGVLRDVDSAEPDGIVIDGTKLWPPALPA